MSTFHTYVVPYDFSEAAAAALRLAAELAGRSHGEVVLVHGMQIPILGSTNPAISVAELVESVRGHVIKRLQDALEKQGVRGTVEVRTEEADQWVPAFVAGLKQPLVILSRHGWSGKVDGLGSVAKRLLRAMTAPVWIAGGPQDGVGKILCAVDVDRAGDRIAEAAKALAVDHRAKLEILHVRDPRVETGYLSEVGWPPAVAVFEDLRREAEAALKKLSAALSTDGLQVEARIAAGPPAREVCREAEAMKADLVVVGKHARGRVETLLLGSTTLELARLWSGHLLVIP